MIAANWKEATLEDLKVKNGCSPQPSYPASHALPPRHYVCVLVFKRVVAQMER
jgi:hypothetical protein